MQRFYSSSQNISGDKIVISKESQLHHFKDVLRLKVNSEIIIFDDKGNEYNCIIEKILSKSALLKIKEKHNFIPSEKIPLTVACAIPKKSKMDDIIDKLTQLGVDRIIPMETERTIVKLDKNKKTLRQERWKKLALSASQQSQRNTLPVIDSVKDIREVLAQAQEFDLKLIPTLTGERKTLRDIFARYHPGSVLILIGPEGDFTSQEVALAQNAGCIPVSLGELVLRVDTAAVSAVSFIQFYANC